MNIWLARAAPRIRGLSPSARVVLLAHVDTPSGHICLAGLDELAQACELSPKHVMRLRAQLVEQGHLRKLAGAHPGQRPVYEVLPNVPIPVSTGPGRSAAMADHIESLNRTARLKPTEQDRIRRSIPRGSFNSVAIQLIMDYVRMLESRQVHPALTREDSAA